MPTSCPNCAASMPDTAAFCPGCGRSMTSPMRAQGTVGVLPETLAGALAYFILPAIVFLLVEPYKTNRFVRFHAFQSLGALLASVIVGAILRIAGVVLFFIPLLGHLLVWLVSMLFSLAFLMICILMILKALQGDISNPPLVSHL